MSLLFWHLPLLLGCLIVQHLTATAQQHHSLHDSLKTARTFGFVGFVLDNFSSKYAVITAGTITTSTECGAYERGNGTSLEIGVGYARDFNKQIALRGLLSIRKGSFQQSFNCTDPAQIVTPTGTTQAITRFVNAFDLSIISLSLFTDFQPFSFPIRFSAGPALGMTINEEYAAQEEVVTPTNAEFLEGGQLRTIGSGSGNGNQISLAADAEIAYPIIAGESLRLLPSLAFRHYLSSPISWTSFNWSSISIRFGLEYQFWKKPIQPSTITELPDEQPAQTKMLPLENPARFTIGWENGVRDTVIIQQQRFIRQQSLPLLPFVFFDSGSVSIPDRYRSELQVGTTSSEIAAAIKLHRKVLDTIGWRLQKNLAATITITGTAPDEPPSRAIKVATARATAVQNYLSDIWGIKHSRIAIAGTAIPESPTISSSAEGSAENIRVEFVSDNPNILAPIIFRDTIIPTATAMISGVVYPGSDSLIAVEVVRETGERKTLEMKNDVGEAHSVRGSIYTVSSANSIGTTTEILQLKVITRDHEAHIVPLYVRTLVSEKIGLEALALFPFGSARLAGKDAEAIRQVRGWTNNNATATLIGSTDDLGEISGNLQLSRNRAAAVADILGLSNTRTEGMGEIANASTLRYPEERMYARSVRVRITD